MKRLSETMAAALPDLLLLAGVLSLSVGAWMAWPPLAPALLGVCLIGLAFLLHQRTPPPRPEAEEVES